jgi:hypothetical protein
LGEEVDMKRFGAVLVFKPGFSAERAAEALELIRDHLALPDSTPVYEETPTGFVVGHKRFEMADKVREFDDDEGGPVWYVP